MTFALMVGTQHIEVQDLTNNNGYIPIKTEDFKTISHYDKILHFINLTAYDESLNLIAYNIETLKKTTFEDKQLLESVITNYKLLHAKINILRPSLRPKRGLINALGIGLKYIAGSMDSEDEKQIQDTLESLKNNENSMTGNVNKLMHINNFMTEQISNITKHVNGQQNRITQYLREFRAMTQNRIKTIEDEVRFIEHIYLIDKDIHMLREHVNDIEQIIFSSKVGITPTEILTQKELDLITDLNTYRNIKVAVIYEDNRLVITLLVPQYSTNILSKIRLEPIPNPNDDSIVLDVYDFYIDNKNNLYKTEVKNNLEKNLIKVENKCLLNILEFKEAVCELEKNNKTSISEIKPGILIFKNFKLNVTHNCNKLDIRQTGNFLIKFENCKIIAMNKTFVNINVKVHDTLILPNRITKIKENVNTNNNLKLETLYLKQINHENNIKIMSNINKRSNVISLSSDLFILFFIIIMFIILRYLVKRNQQIFITPEIKPTGPFLQIATANSSGISNS